MGEPKEVIISGAPVFGRDVYFLCAGLCVRRVPCVLWRIVLDIRVYSFRGACCADCVVQGGRVQVGDFYGVVGVSRGAARVDIGSLLRRSVCARLCWSVFDTVGSILYKRVHVV